MHWASHLTRIEDEKLSEQLLVRELQHGKRPKHKPMNHFSDVVKNDIRLLVWMLTTGSRQWKINWFGKKRSTMVVKYLKTPH